MNDVEVTILGNVTYHTHILKPGEPGKPTNIIVGKEIANGWIGRGLAKLRNPEDEVTKEDLLEQSKGAAKRLREAEQTGEAAKRTMAQLSGKLEKANERNKLLGMAVEKASKELVKAGDKIAKLTAVNQKLEAEAVEGGAELKRLTAANKVLEADLDKVTAPAAKATVSAAEEEAPAEEKEAAPPDK